MPNWVTNKISAPPHVIAALLNAEGRVDFDLIAPFPGPCGKDWDGIAFDAEEAAKIICGVRENGHPLLVLLEEGLRSRFDINNLSDKSFEQFVGMVRNWRACGYLHQMDYARKVWGTKWGACRPTAQPDEGWCQFETAWACPTGLLTLLSERFPQDVINVVYADEDIGANCGSFSLQAGAVVAQDIAPQWQSLDEAGRTRWRAFAYAVTGRTPEPDEDAG